MKRDAKLSGGCWLAFLHSGTFFLCYSTSSIFNQISRYSYHYPIYPIFIHPILTVTWPNKSIQITNLLQSPYPHHCNRHHFCNSISSYPNTRTACLTSTRERGEGTMRICVSSTYSIIIHGLTLMQLRATSNTTGSPASSKIG